MDDEGGMDPSVSHSSSQERRSRVRDHLHQQKHLIHRLLELGNCPGVSVAVLCGDEVVLLEGYGFSDLENKVMSKPETIYPIASISKPFTATACGFLVSEGRLSWDDLISTHIPEFHPVSSPVAGNKATLIDILSHRTGLADEVCLHLGPNGIPMFDDDMSLLSIVNAMHSAPDDFRKVWRYNPLGYSLVALLVERTTDETFANFLSTRVFYPLDMKSTSLISPNTSIRSDNKQEQQSGFARPYTATSKGEFIHRDAPAKAYQFPFDAPMGIQSSAEDMIRWSRAVIQAYRASMYSLDSDQAQQWPVRPTLPEMATILHPWSRLAPNPGGLPAYCLGWFSIDGHFISDSVFGLNEPCTGDLTDAETSRMDPTMLPFPQPWPEQPRQKIFFHSGTANGFTSSLYVLPDSGDAVIVLANSSFCGNAADSVALLLTAILNGHQLDVEALLRSTKAYSDLETGRWGRIRSCLGKERVGRPEGQAVCLEQMTGQYRNEITGLIIRIEGDAEELRCEEVGGDGLRMRQVGASIKFGSVTDLGLRLWMFCENTLCFLPAEKEYQSLGMGYMGHWCQFLIHLHVSQETRAVSGFWWQYQPSEDASWFGRV